MINNKHTGLGYSRPRPPQSGRLNTNSTLSTTTSKWYSKSAYNPGGATPGTIDIHTSNFTMFPTGAYSQGSGTIEFWFLQTGTGDTVQYTYMLDQPQITYWPYKIRMLYRSTSTNQISVSATIGGTTCSSGLLAINAANTWNHIALTFENNTTITVWTNGNRRAIVSDGAGGTLLDTPSLYDIRYWRLFANGNPTSYIQDFRISTIPRYDNANTTYTVPTGPFVNDEYTHALFRFDDYGDSGTGIYDDCY